MAGLRDAYLRPEVVKRSLLVALVVGTVLALINHYRSLAAGRVGVEEAVQILLTYLVPYVVATFSAGRQHVAERQGS